MYFLIFLISLIRKMKISIVIKNSNDLSMYLLNDAHVATVAGAALVQMSVSEFLMQHQLKR